MPTAYLLVSHGSRDPRPEIAMQQLVWLVKKRVKNKLIDRNLQLVGEGVSITSTIIYDLCIGTASLEFSPQPLHEQIRLFAKQAILERCDHLKILPLFLLPGVHVMEDIPREVTQAQQVLGGEIKLDLQPYLGSQSNMKWLVAKQMEMVSSKVDAWVLLAHGSRRPGSLEQIEKLATDLGAVSAYWSVVPSLQERVQYLVRRGYKMVGILPYFLFLGGITDAIAQSIEGLKLKFPETDLQLAQPLAASTDLAHFIGDVIANET